MSLFGWLLKPACPVGLREKTWVETRLRSLTAHLGATAAITGHTITPCDEFFPDPFDESPEAARRLADRVCQHLQVAPQVVTLATQQGGCHSDAGHEKHAGGCGCGSQHNPVDPNTVAIDAARQVSRYRLGDALPSDAIEQRWLIDLTTIALGMGIFVANSRMWQTPPVRNSHQYEAPMPARMVGYALALRTWLAGEQRPRWASYLAGDVASAFHASLRYLEKTEDALLRTDNLYRNGEQHSVATLAARLHDTNASAAIDAIWELASYDIDATAAVGALNDCLTRKQLAVCAEAMRVLAIIGPAAAPAIEHLIDSLHSLSPEIAATSAYALGAIGQQADHVVPQLCVALETAPKADVVAWALAQFGTDAEEALPLLRKRLEAELHRSGDDVDYLTFAIRAIAADPERELELMILDFEAETREQLVSLLPEPGPITVPLGGRAWQYWIDGPS